MTIIPLNEGIFTVTKDKIFTPITREEVKTAGPDLLKMSVCPFLIVLPNDVLLLDAGLGCMKDGKPQIITLIEDAGYTATDITKVLLSHLHKDHVDGLGYMDGDAFISNFPNAEIYLQQNELKYALEQLSSHSFNQEILEQIADLPNLVFMANDKGTIGDHITFEVTGGHTPFHQVFWIKEDSTTAFYGADNLPQISYLKFYIAYKSDFDGKTAKELRQKWEQQAQDQKWTVLFYHDFSKNSVVF
ncbi:MBL fold metallo-hydrolase [Flavobacterium subsaxonicum]|uniref:Beta-lactamase n=1 Tax=Flavobacterium subsaxonicum WB 4.1-42 = DSM 21790 TaxID=1121898 RepID=A0A0A2MLT7_9FLAO|nr:MBL fold metallo-hydrolase [Flavobacterium subsaxonicum]KGO93264.1 beta-lactamase [Flavobacterium subsaxonicum WB 4.1-42 = DSM 21790]